MVKLKIINKNNYDYTLKDEEGRIYNFNLEFLDVEEKIEVGDYISFSEQLLNPKYEGYSASYTFGNLDSKYGKSNIELNDIDVIRVEENEKSIYLKRLYG